MNVPLVTAGLVLLVANVSGWVVGTATTGLLGVGLSTLILLALLGAWLLLAGQRRDAQRVAVRRRGR